MNRPVFYPILLLIVLSALLSSWGCRKSSETLGPPQIEVPPSEEVTVTRLVGKTVDELGNAVAGSRVELFHYGKAVSTVFSDTEGRFEVAQLPLSDTAYFIGVHHTDFSTINRSYQTSGALSDEITIQTPSLSHFETTASIDLLDTTLVVLRGQIRATNGQAAEGIVIITDDQGQIVDHSLADDQGWYEVFVPKDQAFDLQVESFCGPILHSGSIGPYFTHTQLPEVRSDEPGHLVTFSGSMEDCNGNPVVNGELLVKFNTNLLSSISTDAQGRFSFTVHDCKIASSFHMIAEDRTTGLLSDPIVHSFNGGTTSFELNTIQTCHTSTATLELMVDGVTTQYNNHKLTVSQDNLSSNQSLFFGSDFANNGLLMTVNAAETGDFPATEFVWVIDGVRVAFGTTSDITVTFTKHDNLPLQYVEGTLQGQFTDLRDQQQKTIRGSFRLLQL
ncbi:MAG: hypothetical protein AAGG75_11810 [Bacteroidota bacterium]